MNFKRVVNTGRSSFHSPFESLRVFTGNAIPCFGFSPMQIINRISPMVFIMPAKGGETHSDVHPGDYHSVYICVYVTKYTSL